MRAFLIAFALLGAAACSMQGPAVPSAACPTVRVRVVALTYRTNAPIAGAHVAVDRLTVADTDASGVATVPVTAFVEHNIGVSAVGFLAIVPSATATPAADGETWTFWLEPVS